MVDFVTALKTASVGLTLLKEMNAVDKEYDKATLKLKIAELSGALATLQITLAEAQAEGTKKDAEISRLVSNFKQKNEGMVECHGYHYRKGSEGKPMGPAHCPRCLDEGIIRMLVQMHKPGRPYQCPQCKSEYHPTEFNFE